MLKNNEEMQSGCASTDCSCSNENVSKRDFLKGSAYAAGGVSLTSTFTLFTFVGSSEEAFEAKKDDEAVTS